jgi:hypothetical protein
MVDTLETLSWIATIVAVPAIIGGWFFASKRKTNKSVASRGATAISGDVHAGAASIATGHHSPVNVNVTVEVDKQRAHLRLTGLRKSFDGSRSCWQIVIRNEGPAEANNLRVRLLRIEPRPKDWSGCDFPYDVPRANVWRLAGWVSIKFDLNPASEEVFQPFRSWRSSVGPLVVVGLDARDVADLNGMAAPTQADESWYLTYEASAANAEPLRFHLRVYVENENVVAERTD